VNEFNAGDFQGKRLFQVRVTLAPQHPLQAASAPPHSLASPTASLAAVPIPPAPQLFVYYQHPTDHRFYLLYAFGAEPAPRGLVVAAEAGAEDTDEPSAKALSEQRLALISSTLSASGSDGRVVYEHSGAAFEAELAMQGAYLVRPTCVFTFACRATHALTVNVREGWSAAEGGVAVATALELVNSAHATPLSPAMNTWYTLTSPHLLTCSPAHLPLIAGCLVSRVTRPFVWTCAVLRRVTVDVSKSSEPQFTAALSVRQEQSDDPDAPAISPRLSTTRFERALVVYFKAFSPALRRPHNV
jgi:hypothetical protein